MKILWIAFVWPEITSSAAGVRTHQLMIVLKDSGHEVVVVSPCNDNPHRAKLESQGFKTEIFPPNDPRFDDFIIRYQPEIVFFDRFMVEEQFSWRVRQHAPKAIRVLDTIDLHSLRRARERKIAQGLNPFELSNHDLHSEDAIREISAIYRSDLTLVISDFEITLLRERYGVPEELVTLSRLFYPEPKQVMPFESRDHFVMIGNFNHKPNLDSFKILHANLWKRIRERLPHAELHIYGAYPTNEVMRLDDSNTGFRVKGWTSDAIDTLSKYRVNLAALRYGAGVKGKISDGWFAGTPSVATTIAAEGMHAGLDFGGLISDDWEEFAELAGKIYTDRRVWQEAQARGIKIIRELFHAEINSKRFIMTIESLVNASGNNLKLNFVGAMLWHHQHRSTEFFSRWIEEKNKVSSDNYLRDDPKSL